MKQNLRARRVGWCAIACALALRLFALGVPAAVADYIHNLTAERETGRDVRFSPPFGVFSPEFVESPPPFPLDPILPEFSGEETVELYYGANRDPDIPALLRQSLQWDLYQQEPAVLILHTHSTESYTKGAEPYEETASWRTLDEGYNMLSIGARVADLLEQAGIPVLRDQELYDYPSYNGAYVRTRKALRAALKAHPGIRLILDLHRDASSDSGPQMRTQAVVNGEPSAQLMVVVGVNHEDYEQNLSLGLKLHTLLEQAHPGLTRPLQLRPQRFNQDLCPGALLIEVGAAGNTHQEALVAATALAEAIVALARGSASKGA